MRGTRREGKRILLERDSSRNRCGASFAIPIVVSFLLDGDLSLTTIGVKKTTIVAKRTTLLMKVAVTTTACLMQRTNVLCSCRQDGILVLMIRSVMMIPLVKMEMTILVEVKM